MMFIVSLFNLMKQDAVVSAPYYLWLLLWQKKRKQGKKHTQIVSNISFSMSRAKHKKITSKRRKTHDAGIILQKVPYTIYVYLFLGFCVYSSVFFAGRNGNLFVKLGIYTSRPKFTTKL